MRERPASNVTQESHVRKILESNCIVANARKTLAVAFVGALAGLGCCAVALAGAGGQTVREHARSGNVSATFTYRHAVKNEVSPYSAAHLTISRGGRTLHNAFVHSGFCGNLCWPAGSRDLQVADVESDGEPDVLLNLYSGGDHCCYLTQLFRYDTADGAYTMLEHVWGDPGYRLKRLDDSGPIEFVSADDRFAYAFAAYAFSGLPIEVLRVSNGAFVDVTREYPALITRDAAVWWKSYREARHTRYCLGYLAAWAADEYNLGNSAMVATTLAQLASAGELRSIALFGAGGTGFITHLDHFLAKDGYTN
jgi:hypothetical protein